MDREPASNLALIVEAADAVRGADRIALACHVNPDGDALGSMLASRIRRGLQLPYGRQAHRRGWAPTADVPPPKPKKLKRASSKILWRQAQPERRKKSMKLLVGQRRPFLSIRPKRLRLRINRMT